MRWVILSLYLALAGAAVATALATAEEPGAEATVLAADGSFVLANSGEDAPIFTASGIGPGDSTSGTVSIGVSGEPAELTLTQHDLVDSPGLGGGLLSSQLTLLVREPAADPTTVYSGPLATMPAQDLGRIEPGSPRSFEFVATLPEAGATVSQNAVQGASASVAFAWEASEASAEVPPGEGPGGGSPGGGGDGGSAPPQSAGPLDLRVTKVRHRIKGGKLLIWARCDHACAIRARGRLRAHDEDDHRVARLRSSRRSQFRAGTQRLVILLPRRMRHWLVADPSHERGRARIKLLAWDASGGRDRVSRTLRVRSAR